MQDRKDLAVACRIQELVGMPTGGQCACFCFPVPHYTTGHQPGIVENGAVGMSQTITQLAALVN